MRRSVRLAAATWLVLAAAAAPATAGLPCLFDGAGVPLRWPMPVRYDLDPTIGATLGAPLVDAATEAWRGVATAAVQFAAGPPLPVPIDVFNYADYFGRCGDGLSPLIFDPDGTIIEDIAGEGASEFVLGITLHDCGTTTAPVLPETSIVINAAVFGFASPADRAALVSVLTHEIGHQLNLCHTRLNAAFVDDGNAANDAFVPIMFPVLSGDVPLRDPTPRFDDATMLSLLYPAPGFFASTATIGGHVLSGAGRIPVTGTGVVVRSVTDPLGTAQWTTSGWLRIEGPGELQLPVGDVVPAIDGSYQASGLPAGSFTVEVEPGLVDPIGEFYSGASESGDPTTDPPDLTVPVAVAAGVTRTDVTIELAQRVRSLLGETSWDVRWRARLEAQGQSRRLPLDLAPGRLELFSTGAYLVTQVAPLSGFWKARGRRGLRHVVNAEALRALFDLAGASFHITHVTGQGSADRSLTRVRGSIVLHARLDSPPRVPFRIRFLYRGTRTPGERIPGRVPLIPTS